MTSLGAVWSSGVSVEFRPEAVLRRRESILEKQVYSYAYSGDKKDVPDDEGDEFAVVKIFLD